ncbi:MAG: DUF1343 domain-containing protein [Gemmatimonadetes bacterium]|nr:DUF1343 domain-containing protein [Gemmatimonadota bacterium]
METGLEVLLRDSLHLVRGRRVGLITNHTGIIPATGDPAGVASTIDVLHRAPGVDLVALYSPEHGLQGRAEAGEKVASGRDPATGLPIHSLYTTERKPTPEMLAGVDVLLFDIQDIGARYFTYVWTMALAMDAAGRAGLPFIVLDRPNPVGGHLVHGNVLDPAFSTFVGLYPVPMRHGLTAGELARMLVGEHGIRVDLSVVPLQGWRRHQWFDDTGLPWVAPSPNMPSLASATHYPGTCLFEGTNLSVGRGTPAAFQHIGAPWLDADLLARSLNDRALPGVRFEAVTFTPEAPGDGKFPGETVAGLRFVATDRDRYDPTVAAIAALIEIRRAHPDTLRWNVAHFDRLAGTDRVRLAIVGGAGLDEIVGSWPAQVERFERRRAAYLLYE